MLNWNNECGVKLCEIYDEGCSSLSFDYTCKFRDGTELEMETQSDTRHNLKTTPTPTVSLHCEKLPPPCHLFITKKKKKMSKSWYVTMCIANKLQKNNKYVFISCRPQKTSVLGHKSGLKRDDRPSNHHADARSPGQPTPPFIPETLSVRGRDIIAALSNDRLVSKHWKNCLKQPHWSQWTLGFNRVMHCTLREWMRRKSSQPPK